MQNLIKNKYLKYIPSIIWMSFIFFLSSGQTTAVTGTTTQRFIILKTFHLIEYAILFISFKIAGFSTKKSFIFCYLYALSDEFHQSFIPGRSALFRDTIIDLIGSTIGYFSILLTCNKSHTIMK